MLKNYEKIKDGLIKQIEVGSFNYDRDYVDNEKINHNELSALRLGLMVGSVNEPIRSLLDVGYGNGFFLKWASKTIQKCYGYDIEPKYPLPDDIEEAKSITGHHYDVITFFDSLPCFRNLDFIKELRCNYVMVSMPWCHNFSDEWFEKWSQRKPDEYVWHFDDEALRRLMLKNGYMVVHYSNAEDAVKGQERRGHPNSLTGIFKKS